MQHEGPLSSSLALSNDGAELCVMEMQWRCMALQFSCNRGEAFCQWRWKKSGGAAAMEVKKLYGGVVASIVTKDKDNLITKF